MSEFPEHFDQPEDAYFGFFQADSAKNAAAWAAVMSYPHIRVSALGSMTRYETPKEYADRADWSAREATGWVRSEGVPPTRLHEWPNKVHLLGGWTRFNNQDEPILSNRVAYITTRIEGSWGIQARFGVDSFTGEPNVETSAAAIEVVSQFVAGLGQDDLVGCGALCRFPLTVIGGVDVTVWESAAGMTDLLGNHKGKRTTLKEVSAVLTGTRGAVVSLTTTSQDSDDESGLLLVGESDGEWRIAAASGF